MQGQLKAEIKQTRPFDSLEQEVFLNLMRTTALLEHGMGEAVKGRGVTLTQYNVLRILRGAGEEGLCRHEVQDRMVKPVPDVTRLLDRLEAQGLVGRARAEDDRRRVIARITPAGLRLLAELDEPVAAAVERYLGHMGERDLRRLASLLVAARARA